MNMKMKVFLKQFKYKCHHQCTCYNYKKDKTKMMKGSMITKRT